MENKEILKENVKDMFSGIFEDYVPTAPLEETVSKKELLAMYPGVADKTFKRFKAHGCFDSVTQFTGKRGFTGGTGLEHRFRKDRVFDIMSKIIELKEWSVYKLVSRILELERENEKLRKRKSNFG